MVFAVQCPNEKCKKYQLVEDYDKDKVVHCLLCKSAIRTGGAPKPKKDAGSPPRK